MSIKLKINGREVVGQEGQTILQVAQANNIDIPTLCYLNLHEIGLVCNHGSCRVCVVEVAGRRNLCPACVTPITEGMDIQTNSPRARLARKTNMDLLLSNHPQDCLVCEKSGNCALQELATKLQMKKIDYAGPISQPNHVEESIAIQRNPAKCILCGHCVDMCSKVQTVGALGSINRGFDTKMGPALDKTLDETACVNCGQCVTVCPTGALTQRNQTDVVRKVLRDPNKYVVIQTAPATRVALGDEFGYEVGTNVAGKMVAALRELGFKKVFDTNFAADLTIIEETAEFLERFTKKENLPLITSCCPGWIKFIEHQYPELLNHPSSCKSPQNMEGALIKTYFAEKAGIDPKDIFVVSLMPCIAKKYESQREELSVNGLQDVDLSISVHELAVLIKEEGINFRELADAEFDSPLGDGTGAADIFANTGGVLEAVVRHAAKELTGEDKSVEYHALRGESGIQTATVNLNGAEIKVAVASGLGNARKLLEEIKAGTCEYDAIEVMACPGGCVAGGGQPIHIDMPRVEVIAKRHAGIYAIDAGKPTRISSQNPDVKRVYDEYLGKPNSHKAHELLHTHFVARKK